MSSDILVAEDLGDGIQRLTMNRPDRLNAMNHPVAEGMLAHFEGLRRNTAVRVVILRGAGRGVFVGRRPQGRGHA